MKWFPSKKIIRGCDSRGDGDSPYLTRWTLLTTPFGGLYLHIFHRSDHDVYHDHPAGFVSLILRGGYIEETPKGKSRKWPGMVLFRRASWMHRVELVKERPAVTLLWRVKAWRPWGFFTERGFEGWTDYFKRLGC